MKKTIVFVLMTFASLSLWAQSIAAMGNTDVDAERARLTAEQAAVDKAFAAQRAVCFQKFAVEDCLEDSRRTRRAAMDNIKRQRALIDDAERKRRGADALKQLDSKNSPQRQEEAADRRGQALQSQQERDRRARDAADDRAAAVARQAENRRAFESRQRAHTQDLADEASRRAQAPEEAKRYESKQQKAEAHRADLAKRNAERTEPRAASLPPPPP